MPSEIPEGVRDFIKRYINSISILEVLLLMKQNPERTWTAQNLSDEMRTNQSYASSQLAELTEAGLLQKFAEGEFRFAVNSSHGAVMDELAELYHSRRSTVIDVIYAPSMEGIRDFANAFKIKRK